MRLRLKNINYDKITIGTEVYSIWDKRLIGIVTNITDDKNRYGETKEHLQLLEIEESIQPDYCKYCKRGSKTIVKKRHIIHISQLKYKKYK